MTAKMITYEDLQSEASDLAMALGEARYAATRSDWATLDGIKARLVHEQDDAAPRRADLLEFALSEMDKLNAPADPTQGMDAQTIDTLTTQAPAPAKRCGCGALLESPIHSNDFLDGYHLPYNVV